MSCVSTGACVWLQSLVHGFVDGANEPLRCLKSHIDAGLKWQYMAAIDELVFVCFSDAACAVRHDSGGQNGVLTVACHLRVWNGEESDNVVDDWKSSRLPKLSRRSLQSESQSPVRSSMQSSEHETCQKRTHRN